MIRSANAADASALCAIYNHYIATTTISFEETPVSSADMAQRIAAVQADLPWLVHEDDEDGAVAGYAYATKWRARAAYRNSVETSVYVAPNQSRRGIGANLYRALLADLRERRLHVAIAGIALPNDASVGLHEHCGFTKVAHFAEVGHKFDQWIDVGYWQLQL